ncbi:MAG: hypothetical protein ACLFVU_15275 [Phycisphaerae bacterium]
MYRVNRRSGMNGAVGLAVAVVVLCWVGTAETLEAAPNQGPAFGRAMNLYRAWEASVRQGGQQRCVLVEVLNMPDSKGRGKIKAKIRVLADLTDPKKKAEPQEMEVESLTNLYYRGKGKKWQGKKMAAILVQPKGAKKWLLAVYITPFHDISGTDDPLIKAAREVLWDVPDEPVKAAANLIDGLKSKDPYVRAMAVVHASRNRSHHTLNRKTPEQLNEFARILLQTKDNREKVQLRAAMYDIGGDDLLPTDEKVFGQLMGVSDGGLRQAIISYALGPAIQKRTKEVQPLIASVLKDPKSNELQLKGVLAAMAAVGTEAADLAPLAAPVAERKSVPMEIRRAAATIALSHTDKEAGDRAIEYVIETGSAGAMLHLVENNVSRAVPEILAALREKKLKWSGELRNTLALLTKRQELKSFDQFDQWWTRMTKTGQAEKLIKTNFARQVDSEKLQTLLADLDSPKYAVRSKAQRALAGMKLSEEMPEVADALENGSVEVVGTLRSMLRDRENMHDDLRQVLRTTAGREISGLTDGRHMRIRRI